MISKHELPFLYQTRLYQFFRFLIGERYSPIDCAILKILRFDRKESYNSIEFRKRWKVFQDLIPHYPWKRAPSVDIFLLCLLKKFLQEHEKPSELAFLVGLKAKLCPENPETQRVLLKILESAQNRQKTPPQLYGGHSKK
ncbi:MAG TPA: hypothetical protein VFM02_04470 [Candidatus Paceibacterota bacterium]|nr:hypothetical protein [Candidatus Paceibacterota bacterium]